ncbi:hypothetical protein MLD38_014140 [Melastoma candidum]|uniref:Uncharacterized protein n=1 Tax=Melastoma candidum TaxID=119954 RepID=A0ACB9REX2_9MYRT|nr:hypothetical protein MLD38_014140 [Melastoma candidum]
MARPRDALRVLSLALTVALCFFSGPCLAGDPQALLKFKVSLTNPSALDSWQDNGSSPGPCSWAGVWCKDGAVIYLKLDNMGLAGTIDVDALTELPLLRYLSMKNNNFEGPLPKINKLRELKFLILSDNKFGGEIPEDAFDGMRGLRMIYLNGNSFTGHIPRSLTTLPNLSNLSLAGNQLSGKIPDFQQTNLHMVDLANNHFEGSIPRSLAMMNSSYFAGVGASLLALLVIAAVLYTRKRSKYKKAAFALKKPQKTTRPREMDVQLMNHPPETKQKGGGGGGSDQGKLVFVQNDRERFELQDLLRASAEVLGSGSFGSSYKAVLLSGPAVVVRRFKHMNNVGKEEFHEHMKQLGRLSHPNLLPLVAFYYRKEEKLVISDYVENGSLASHLHANRKPGELGLDWPVRLRILKGVATGLAYLHREFPNLAIPHGHLKSSNVLLNRSFEPLLTDYGLIPVVNKDHASHYMVAYKCPESAHAGRKSDVWSLGMLILEVLTGKFPASYLRKGRGGGGGGGGSRVASRSDDLASWVDLVVREEWTGEVFDKDMAGTRNGEGEMLKLLKIGMSCCEWSVERRLGLREAVERILELKERDGDEEYYTSYASEGDGYSSRALTDDDFSFSVTK